MVAYMVDQAGNYAVAFVVRNLVAFDVDSCAHLAAASSAESVDFEFYVAAFAGQSALLAVGAVVIETQIRCPMKKKKKVSIKY